MSKIFKRQNVSVNSGETLVIDAHSDFLRGLAKAAKEAQEPSKEEIDEQLADENERLRAEIVAQARKEAETILTEARWQADEMKNEARREAKSLSDNARELTETAKREADEIFETAKTEGYDIGYSDGMESVEAKQNEADDVLRDAKKQRETTLANLEGEVVDVIAKTVEKLIGAAADVDSRVIMCLIKQGFDNATIIGDVKVHVSKDDFDDVYARKNEISAMTKGAEPEIVKNLSLNKSDCIIETHYGNIDCSLDRQFAELRKNLYHIYKEEKG